MSWWDITPTLLVAIGYGVLPGLLLAQLLGLRGITLIGSAPAFSITTIAIASVAAPLLGISWGLIPVAVTTAALAVVVIGFRALWHRLRPHPPLPHDPPRVVAFALIGVGIAALIIGVRLAIIFGSPDAISQTYDNIFHLNALRYIVETGNASSLTLSGLPLDTGKAGGFYPAVWHALVALIVDTTGAGIPVAVNAVSLLMGAIFWPLGCVFLVRQIVGSRAFALVAGGILSAAFGATPFILVDFGVLYPYLLGVSILPAGLAYALAAARVGVEPTLRPSRARFALLGVVPGIALAHPSAVLSLLVLCVPVMLFVIHREWQRLRIEDAPRHQFVILLAVWTITFAAMAAAWLVLRVDTAWVADRTLAQALGEALLNAPVGLPVAWIVTALMVAGVVTLVRRRVSPWMLGALGLVMFIYVVAAGVPHSPFRAAVIGPWYGDAYRLASLLPIAVLPVAAIGLTAIHDWAINRRNETPRERPRAWVFSAAAIVLALLATQGASVQYATERGTFSYTLNEESPLLTPDELDVLKQVDELVPADATVAGNPWTGASLVYAISNRSALLPHVSGYQTAESRILATRLHRAQSDPSVCEAVEVTGARYVLDFGTREVHGGAHDYRGFTRLANSPVVTPLYENASAGLYEITACDG